MIPVAFLVTIGVFVLVRLSPADPALVFAGEERDPATIAAIRQEQGLDRPLPLQYVTWITRLVQGDLGRSFQTHQRVLEAIWERLPATLELGLAALVFSVTIALLVGIRIWAIIEGGCITERTFFWPGIGRLAVQAIPSRDYPVVQGVVLVSAFSFMFTTLVVDVLYAWLDPRISYLTASSLAAPPPP